MQTKIRTTIIALVAAFSFAATVAPAAQALPTRVPIGTSGTTAPTTGVLESKNDGRYQKSAEARKFTDQQCSWVMNRFNAWNDTFLKEHAKDPNSQATLDAAKQANYWQSLAISHGCMS